MAKRLNYSMIRKVLRHIKGDLRRLEMGAWAYTKENGGDGEKFAKCGTKACMAGWAVLLNTPKKNWNEVVKNQYSIPEEAAKILGFNDYEAAKVFRGDAMDKDTPREQYVELRKQINEVIAKRGSKVRV